MNKKYNIDDIFGPFKITINLSPIPQVYENEIMIIADWCKDNVNSMITYSVYGETGQTVVCFDNEQDATLFALRWK